MLWISLPQSVVLSSSLSGSLETLIENTDSRPHPRPTESESLGVNPHNLHFQHTQTVFILTQYLTESIKLTVEQTLFFTLSLHSLC